MCQVRGPAIQNLLHPDLGLKDPHHDTVTPLCWDHPLYSRTCAKVCVAGAQWVGHCWGHTHFIPSSTCTSVVAMPFTPALRKYRQEDQELKVYSAT